MTELSTGRKLGVIGGFFVSSLALSWLLSFPVKPPQVFPRLGFACATLCAIGLFIFCWSAAVAYVARKRNWSPRVCYMAGLLFAIPGSLLFFLSNAPTSIAPAFLVPFMTLGGYLSRKLAYPELSDEEASALEPPLSLFPK
jgi:hypothetical protein